MSVSTTGSPTFEAYPSGADPRVAQGNWFATAAGNGDGSAGTATATIQFFGSTHTPTGQVFSLQGVDAIYGGGATAADDVLVTTNGWDYGNNAGSTNRSLYMIQCVADPVGNFRGYARDQGATQEFFLGSPVDGSASIVSVTFTNVNSMAYRIACWGQWWIPEAKYLPGGPVREASVFDTVGLELQGTRFGQAIRSGELGQRSLQQLVGARLANPIISRSTAAPLRAQRPAIVSGTATGQAQRAQVQRAELERTARVFARQVQLTANVQRTGRLVAPGATTRDIQEATAAPIALSALIASAPQGITIQQAQAFGRASRILADPRFARTES